MNKHHPPSKMHQEIFQIPDVIANILQNDQGKMLSIASQLRDADPRFLATIARGSSDHVATYFKYICEISAHKPVASLGPSVASVYGQNIQLDTSAVLAISQSGQSPDIVSMTHAASESGALTLALTNFVDSPLAKASDHPIDIQAGLELSVAATKTFIASAFMALWLVGEWTQDLELLKTLQTLPKKLEEAVNLNWSDFREALSDEEALFCLGRGPAYAMSNEAALKFKETCQIHAESYSSAEVMHGPVSIVSDGFPILALACDDKAEPFIVDIADQIAKKGGNVFVSSPKATYAKKIERIETGHAFADSIALMASFYANVEKIASERGLNPDEPRHLKKVTETT